MRMTLDIPQDLMEEARQLLGFKSKRATVVVSLQELVRHRRIEELKSLFGAIDLDLDINTSRWRS